MAGRLLSSCVRSGCVRSGAFKVQLARMSASPGYTDKVGNREVVGYGVNGEASYMDLEIVPMPAVRFKETTPDIQALQEKEKGDWKKLSIEEKKALYRASFCQTFAEMNAPTGQWKSIVGMVLMFGTTALWIYIMMRKFVYEPLPKSFSEESQLMQLERMIKLDVNPIDGLCKRK